MRLKAFKGVSARLLLVAALVCATAAVASAAPRRGGARACPLSRTHDCCKRARRGADAPRLLPFMPCCVTNTPQPAPVGTSYNAQPAPGVATDPRPFATTNAPAAARPRTHAPTFSPTHSPPAYIRHASFLI